LASVLPETLSASALAIAGMAAVVSTVVGAPISTVIIVLELTGNYEMAIGTTIAVVFAHLVTHRFVGRSLFDRQLMARGLDLSTGRERVALARQSITPWIVGDCVRVTPEAAAQRVIGQLTDADASVAFVVDRGGRYLGHLSLVDLVRTERRGDGAAKAGELLRPSKIRLASNASLLEAIELLGRFTGESAPVVDIDGETFLGVVRESAILEAYQKISQAVRRLEE
jgi:CIC family chloride channel protein